MARAISRALSPIVLCASRSHPRSSRDQDAEARNRSDFGAGETVEGDAAVKNEPLKLIRGSGNVYLDLGQGDADVKQLKALLAAEIIKTLDRDKLTVHPRPLGS
ncbi:MAG TPA: hypothetical protein VE083_11885 [Terriglobales bacterium]|nr:hypothetical protein [Terriglobales bacterium]